MKNSNVRKKRISRTSANLKTDSSVDKFLQKLEFVRPTNKSHSRLLFSMDATASREATWDAACQIQGEMFESTANIGNLSVQLAYYRGFNTFHATPWLHNSAKLIEQMNAVQCAGGYTQISKILHHAISETKTLRLDAIVFIGDCMEENIDELCGLSGELAMHKVPIFVFHEGNDEVAANCFQKISQLTGGAYLNFDSASAQQLKALLRAVAVYATGGREALKDYGKREGGPALRIAGQVN